MKLNGSLGEPVTPMVNSQVEGFGWGGQVPPTQRQELHAVPLKSIQLENAAAFHTPGTMTLLELLLTVPVDHIPTPGKLFLELDTSAFLNCASGIFVKKWGS